MQVIKEGGETDISRADLFLIGIMTQAVTNVIGGIKKRRAEDRRVCKEIAQIKEIVNS